MHISRCKGYMYPKVVVLQCVMNEYLELTPISVTNNQGCRQFLHS